MVEVEKVNGVLVGIIGVTCGDVFVTSSAAQPRDKYGGSKQSRQGNGKADDDDNSLESVPGDE